ncbi:MAG TPA: ankyrin repeat domain-containing protein [Puia sp.]|nr:ankyrin repeat domain-containing protein [Puia sp.]
MTKYFLFSIFTIFGLASCDNILERNPIRTKDIYIEKYKDFIKAISDEDLLKIERIFREKNIDLNYSDSVYGVSFLNWCIFNKRVKSFQKLLELGADPNWQDSNCKFAPSITEAAKVDYTSKFLELSLINGGNANLLSKRMSGSEDQSPLFGAIFSRRMESLILLTNKNVDVNLTQDSLWTPLAETLIHNKIEMTKYLIDHGADYNNLKFKTKTIALDKNKQPILNSDGSPIMKYDGELNILDFLRNIQFPLNSKEYLIKMEIINFLKLKGLDYFNYPIPDEIKNQHKHDTAYLSKY